MAANKTIRVAPLARTLQTALRLAQTDEERKAFVFAIERVLHESGNYHGFQHFGPDLQWTDKNIRPDEENYYRRNYYLPQERSNNV